MIEQLREQILDGSQPLVELIQAVIRRDPSVSTQQQILVVAIAFVLVMFVVTLLLAVFAPRKRTVLRRRRVVRSLEQVASQADAYEAVRAPGTTTPAKPQPEWRRSAQRLALGVPGMLLVLLLFFAASYGISSTNAFCTFRCHQDLVEEPVQEASAPLTATGVVTSQVTTMVAEATHHDRCATCHSTGLIADVMDRGRMIAISFSASQETSPAAVVESRSCLRCHRDVLSTVVIGKSSNVRMSHKEPHEAGMACDYCHGRTGHEGTMSPKMSSCSECHDDVTASVECETCHVESPSNQSTRDLPQGSASKRVYGAVPLDDDRCYECHKPASCDSCHGVRVPHTQDFLTGRHAYYAAWDRKQQCQMCHTTTWCQQCHLSFAGAHYAGWEQDHANSSPTAGCACHDRRNPSRTEPFCTVCHRTR